MMKPIKVIKNIWRFSRANIIAPLDFYFKKNRVLATQKLLDEHKKIPGNISTRIHPNDQMYVSFLGDHYLEVGFSAVQCILDVLCVSKTPPIKIKRILDFACGHGRVLRILKAVFPDAHISGAEVDSTALTFCKNLFDIKPILSSADFEDLAAEEKFNMIWCGSLITHLPEEKTIDLLRYFYESLEPGGLCIFSTHGELVAQMIQTKSSNSRLPHNLSLKLCQDYRTSGYGFESYGKDPNYGTSLVNPERMRLIAAATGNWSEIFCKPEAWANHHDVYAYRKN